MTLLKRTVSGFLGLCLSASNLSAADRFATVDAVTFGDHTIALSLYSDANAARSGEFSGVLTDLSTSISKEVTVHVQDYQQAQSRIELNNGTAFLQTGLNLSTGRPTGLDVSVMNQYTRGELEGYIVLARIGGDTNKISVVGSVKTDPIILPAIGIILIVTIFYCTTSQTAELVSKCGRVDISTYFKDVLHCQASCA